MTTSAIIVESVEKIEEVPVKRTKNFRELPDIENFYRFIYENDLRRETKMLLETLWTAYIKRRKQLKKAGVLH